MAQQFVAKGGQAYNGTDGRSCGADCKAKDRSMLVLSRKKNESIMIGDSVVITIVEIRGDRVRLGIEAPPEVPVHRREVYEALRRAVSDSAESETSSG